MIGWKAWRNRFLAHRRINREVAIWYHPEYVAQCLARSSRVLEINLDRGELILGHLSHEMLIGLKQVRLSPIVGFDELKAVHPQAYLESTTKPEVLGKIFGLDPESVRVDDLLLAQRRAVGGTVDAALAVTRTSLQTAFNLGGGFHHAEPSLGAGFCVYNDVAVAVARLREAGYKERIAVVDLDYHEGNGNVAALANDPAVWCFSIHGSVWTKQKPAIYSGLLLPPGTDDEGYLRALGEALPGALHDFAPRLVFYVAGNDVLAEDRLGDFQLSPRGVLERDRLVADTVRELGAKLVITLSGGYSPQAWQCSGNFIRYLLTDELKATEAVEPKLREKFRKIAWTINPLELQEKQTDALSFSEEDLLGDLGRISRVKRLLGFYSDHGVELAFERFGILKKIREKGYENLRMQVDPSDPDHQIVRVFGHKSGMAADLSHGVEQLLLELVLRKLYLPPAKGSGWSDPLNLLSVEWLLLKNPLESFSNTRPQLPGQDHPGLGIAEDVQEIMVQACSHLGLDGIHSRPSHYHNAWIASQWFHFLDPEDEGILLAWRRTLSGFNLAESARIVEQNGMRLADGTIMKWNPSDQLLAVSPRLSQYFKSKTYREAAKACCRRLLDAGLHAVVK